MTNWLHNFLATITSKHSLEILTRKMPSRKPENFSWTVEGLLAASAIPFEPAHFQYYLDQNIKTLVTLTEFQPPMRYSPPGLKHVFLPIVEFRAPSIQDMEKFTDLVEESKAKGEALCVHCHWGRGRTGTMLAAYLVGYCSFAPRRAIKAIRQTRPYSIETHKQEEAVFDFAKYMEMKRKHGAQTQNGEDQSSAPKTESKDEMDKPGSSSKTESKDETDKSGPSSNGTVKH